MLHRDSLHYADSSQLLHLSVRSFEKNIRGKKPNNFKEKISNLFIYVNMEREKNVE